MNWACESTGRFRLFRVELTNPTPFFLGLCAFQTLSVRSARRCRKARRRMRMHVRPLPVSGPYQLERWSLNDRVRLRAKCLLLGRNEYPLPGRGSPADPQCEHGIQPV